MIRTDLADRISYFLYLSAGAIRKGRQNLHFLIYVCHRNWLAFKNTKERG